MRASSLIPLAFVVTLLLSVADAKPRFQQEIPNIPIVDGTIWPGVGHLNHGGGGQLTPFGQDFRAAGFRWTPELCRKDSDGDGFTNGQELGDPNCTWRKGEPRPVVTGRAISHPGFATSVPQKA